MAGRWRCGPQRKWDRPTAELRLRCGCLWLPARARCVSRVRWRGERFGRRESGFDSWRQYEFGEWEAALAIAFTLSGCALHRRAQPFLLPPFTPVELAQVPEPAEPAMVEGDDDEEDLPPVPVAEGASVPKRQRRKVVVKAPAPDLTPVSQPPAQVATAAPQPAESESASVIGDLTPGRRSGSKDPAGGCGSDCRE